MTWHKYRQVQPIQMTLGHRLVHPCSNWNRSNPDREFAIDKMHDWYCNRPRQEVLVQTHGTGGPRDCVQSRRLKGEDGGLDGPSTDENTITYGS